MTLRIAIFAGIVASGAVVIVWNLWFVHFLQATWPLTGTDSGYAVVDLKEICSVPASKVPDAPPAAVRRLDGRLVRFDGLVDASVAGSDRARAFRLFDHLGWGGGAPVSPWEHVVCTMAAGRTIEDHGLQERVHVYGTLHVGVHRDQDGIIDSIYRLDVDRVIPFR